MHVNQAKGEETNGQTDKKNIFFCFKSEKKTIPDLYPINISTRNENFLCTKIFEDTEQNLTNGEITAAPDDFNPIKFCSITMEVKNQKKKYPCTFCAKVFGWSTDLKRHILTHTGQRPFKCKLCDATFTRNFLLQKHENKAHQTEIKLKIPNLKPIQLKSKDSRKQDKQKIKRKCFYEKKSILPQFNMIVDSETIVQ